MTYTIRRYENTSTTTTKANILVTDNSINTTSTSLSLVGQSTDGYLSPIAENFIWSIENFYGSAPPDNALIGQLWYNDDPDPEIGGLYYWDGPDPTNGGNSTIPTRWVSLTNDLSDDLERHVLTVSPQNAHSLTKDQLYDAVANPTDTPVYSGGLADVRNVRLYDKSKNLESPQVDTEYPGNPLIIDYNAVRMNLNVYDKSEVYNRAEVDFLFTPIGQDVVNTLRLDGYFHDEFILVSDPIIDSGIDFNTITEGRLFETDNQKISCHVSDTNNAFTFRGGLDDSDALTTPGTSGIKLELLSGATPEINVKMYTTSLAMTLSVKDDGLYVNSGKVFHTDFKPTPAETGSYAVDEQVDNSVLLSGFAPDQAGNVDTIVQRDGNQIRCGYFNSNNEPEGGMTGDSNIMFRNSPTDNALRFANITEFNKYLLRDINITQAWGGFNGRLQPGDIYNTSTNVTIAKLGTGVYEIRCYHFTGYGPTTNNFPIIMGVSDDGGFQTSYASGSYRLGVIRKWASSIARNQAVPGNAGLQYVRFRINCKKIQNRYRGPQLADYFRAVYFDPGYVSFNVIW